MIIVTIVRTVSIAKNSPYRIERYRECYIVFANTISPLWLCSYCNVSPTQNVVWSYTRYSSQCCIGAIAIPSTSSWTTTKQQCWTNKNVEYQWENGFIVWDYSPLFIQPRVRYKGYHRNSCSNNQKRLLLMSNLRDDNDRYFQWCCCERYLQRHNTL